MDVNTFERTLNVGVFEHSEGPPEVGYETYCVCGLMRMNPVLGAVFALVRVPETMIFPICRTEPPAVMAKTVALPMMAKSVYLPHSPTSSWSRVARYNHWVRLPKTEETKVVAVQIMRWGLWVTLSRRSYD